MGRCGMREIGRTAHYKKDLKRLAKSGRYDLNELEAVIQNLANDLSLAEKHHDHALFGDWIDHRDCHIRPDWILIYRLEPGHLILVRTGSHSDLLD